MKQFFKPLKGCRVVASDSHPYRNSMDYIGEVVEVDGNIIKFRDRTGFIDSMIWRFNDGDNKFIWFSA